MKTSIKPTVTTHDSPVGYADSHRAQRGFTSFEALIVALVVGMLGFAGWQALQTKAGVSGEYDAIHHAGAYDSGNTPVNSFYSCVDRVKSFEPGETQKCRYADKVYERPAGYTPDNVRNFEHLPADSQPAVAALARKNFIICQDDPATVSITRVLNVIEGYIYLSTGCDGGYAVVMVRQGIAWKEVNLGQAGLGCDVAQQYQIPEQLVYNKSQAESDKCYTAEGDVRPLEA